MRGWPALCAWGTLWLAGCASHAPAPVAESRPPVRVEPAKPVVGTPVPPASQTVPLAFHTVKRGDTLHGIALDHGVDYRDLAAWNGIENVNRIRVGQQLRLASPVTASTPVGMVEPGSAEIKPIAVGGPVVARSLDGSAAPAPVPAVSVPTSVPGNSEILKRAPKGGKLPYSDENLARMKAQGAVPAATPVAAAPQVPTVMVTEKPPVTEKPAPAAGVAGAPAPSTPLPVQASPPEGEVVWAWPANGKLLAGFGEGAEASKGLDIAGKIGDPVLAAAAGKVVYVGSGLRGYGNLVIVRHSTAFLSAYAHNSVLLVKEGQAVKRGEKIAELGNSDADQPKLHFEVRQQGKPVDPLKFLPTR